MDQIANMLIAMKNAGFVKKATVTIPSSKMKLEPGVDLEKLIFLKDWTTGITFEEEEEVEL